jgi:hypothetical protein
MGVCGCLVHCSHPPHLLLLHQVPGMLAAAGASKLTFVGGEPMLHPMLPQLIQAAKEAGLTTCLVTNGSRLTEAWLHDMKPYLDWLALSVRARPLPQPCCCLADSLTGRPLTLLAPCGQCVSPFPIMQKIYAEPDYPSTGI